MEKRLMTLAAGVLLSTGMALAQSHISGKVTSAEDGEPVIGATVKVVGSKTAGAVTDINGNFSISAPAGAQLEITYIGMEKQTVKASNNMTIKLSNDNQSLGEVVVTGYGSARKLGTIAGSVETVSASKLQNRPVANVADAMQGQVAGLQVLTSSGEPSAVASMTIRGTTSIYASTEPLFILDGSEISQNTFISLNPNDIESMTVLKDASSTAIYGSRAANGVIIVTSKKGKFGEAPTVSVSAMYGISQMTSDNSDMMNANQWLNLQELMKPELANSANFQAQKAYYQKYNIGTDWAKKLFSGSAPTSQVDVSVRGGSQNTSYLLSYGHYNADGIMDDSSLRRETLRANIDVTINPWLKVGTKTAFAYTKDRTAAYTGGLNSGDKVFTARTNIPIQPYYEVKGLVYDNKGAIDWANSTFDGFGDRLNILTMTGGYNPYYLSERQPGYSTRIRLNENAYVNISPIKGLNIRSAVGLDANDFRVTQKNLQTPDISFLMEEGKRGENFNRFYRWTVTNTAEYKFNIAKKHDFTVLVGQETMSNKSSGFGVRVKGLKDNRLFLMSAASIKDNVESISQDISEEVRNSWFGQLNYSFADKYFVDLSVRRDGSSLFADGHRWATFGAAAVMWDVTNENFMAPTRSWLDDLQLKLSYGSTGNSGIKPYMALGLVGSGPSYNGQSGTAIANPGNPDLTWETVKTLNVGLHAKVLKRYTLDAEFYNKVTSNMLMTVPYSYTTGFGSGWGNVAEMVNRGIDLTVSADIINNKDWYWNVRLNANYNHNEITKVMNNADAYDYSDLIHFEKGHAFGEHYAVRWSHVDPRDGQNVWLDKNGNYTKKYDENDRVLLGKGFKAPWEGSLMTTLSWKGLQLDVQFNGMFERYLLNNERWFTENPRFATQMNPRKEMATIWTKPGDVTKIAAANAEYQFDTHLIENASFVRLKMLQLSYNLPQSILRPTQFIKDAKVYVVGRNLLTFTDYKGLDPEVDSYSSVTNYPNTRQYSIGVQLTF